LYLKKILNLFKLIIKINIVPPITQPYTAQEYKKQLKFMFVSIFYFLFILKNKIKKQIKSSK